MFKFCVSCKISKNTILYSNSELKKNSSVCKDCIRCYNKIYRENNKKIKAEKDKIYYQNNKDKILRHCKNYYQEKKERILQYHREYYKNNTKTILDRNKEYEKRNCIKLTVYRNNYWKNRRKTDIVLSLKETVSHAVYIGLISNGSNKNNKSVWSYLPYSPQDLKKYIFSHPHFMQWMNESNHGVYNKKNWNDNDPSTWTWNIDHIIPHSTFKYTSMEDQIF